MAHYSCEVILHKRGSIIPSITANISKVEIFSNNYGFFLHTILEKTLRSRRMSFVAASGVNMGKNKNGEQSTFGKSVH